MERYQLQGNNLEIAHKPWQNIKSGRDLSLPDRLLLVSRSLDCLFSNREHSWRLECFVVTITCIIRVWLLSGKVEQYNRKRMDFGLKEIWS